MAYDVLTRLREGIRKKKFTLTAVAKESGIPLTTLDHMRKEKPAQRIEETLTRLEAIDKAMNKLAPEDNEEAA